jgi:hypothetical protein
MNSLSSNFNELRRQFEQSKNATTAIAILDAYFNCYKPDNFHEELWLLRCLLTMKEFPASELQRENLIFFIDAIMLVLQVVHWVYTSESCEGLPY